MKYRKLPVIIEAFRMGIDNRPDWFQDKVSDKTIITFIDGIDNGPFGNNKTYCQIHTLEGVMTASYGDYVIKGIHGEIYPCKPAIFKLTYELETNEA